MVRTAPGWRPIGIMGPYARGRVMSVAISRQGQGPDLVLLHGWGMNRRVWQTVVPALSTHFCLHLVDLPGYGESDWEGGEYSLSALVDALLPALPERAYWLGWSMGGLIATQLAWQYPERVAGLILVASSPRFVAEPGWPGIRPEVLANFHRQLAQDPTRTLERFLAIQAMGSEQVREDTRRLKALLVEVPLPSTPALAGGLDLLLHSDLRPQWQQLRVPTWRLYGRLDSLVPCGVIPAITALAPNSPVSLFDKASHAPFLSHPAPFVDEILRCIG